MKSSIAILIVDAQNEFAKPNGKLYEKMSKCMEKKEVMKKLPAFCNEARESGAVMIYSQLLQTKEKKKAFLKDAYNSLDTKNLFLQGTWNAEIIEEIKPQESDVILTERESFDCGEGNTQLLDALETNKIKKLFVVGFGIDTSIIDTLLEISDDGIVDLIVVEDCCAATSLNRHKSATRNTLPLIAQMTTAAKWKVLQRSTRLTVAPKQTSFASDAAQETRKSGDMETLAAPVKRLRDIMVDKWISGPQIIKFFDQTRDGKVDFEEFSDCLHDFGLKVDAAEAFKHLDTGNKGWVLAEYLSEVLTPSAEDYRLDKAAKNRTSLTQKYETDLLIALVAHNHMKPSMMNFVKDNLDFFCQVKLVTTGSTGRALSSLGLGVEHLVSSGPLGGDQEIGSLITLGRVSAVFFFTDPLSAHPHQADIDALIRICCVHDTMLANNPSTAKCLVEALEHSPFGFACLTGINQEMQEDSKIVQDYKEEQQKVIKSVTIQVAGSPPMDSAPTPSLRQTISVPMPSLRQSLSAPMPSLGRRSLLLRASSSRASILHAPRKSLLHAWEEEDSKEFSEHAPALLSSGRTLDVVEEITNEKNNQENDIIYHSALDHVVGEIKKQKDGKKGSSIVRAMKKSLLQLNLKSSRKSFDMANKCKKEINWSNDVPLQRVEPVKDLIAESTLGSVQDVIKNVQENDMIYHSTLDHVVGEIYKKKDGKKSNSLVRAIKKSLLKLSLKSSRKSFDMANKCKTEMGSLGSFDLPQNDRL